MMESYKKGDVVSYVRNTDGTTVTGEITYVYTRSPYFTHLPLFDVISGSQRKEHFAYRLRLNEKDAERIGHPVTIGHSRVKQ